MVIGWLKMVRSDETIELLKKPLAFALLAVISLRCKWRDGFNTLGLETGEALIGDHRSCGLSRQEYRTAVRCLERHRFATFRPTTKGTIATITDTRVFDISADVTNHLDNQRSTTNQPSSNHRPTTNEEGKDRKRKME